MFKECSFHFIERQAEKIWFMGSSIVYWASQSSKQDTKRGDMLTAQEVKWHGERGMGWSRFRPKVDTLLRTEPPPRWLCILLGSNDLGKKPLHELISCAKMNLMYVTYECPEMKIIWSDILPRIEYRGAISNKKLEVASVHCNRKM